MNGEPSYIFVDGLARSGQFISVRDGDSDDGAFSELSGRLVGRANGKLHEDLHRAGFDCVRGRDPRQQPSSFRRGVRRDDTIRRTRRPRHAYGIANFDGPCQVTPWTGVHLYDAESPLLQSGPDRRTRYSDGHRPVNRSTEEQDTYRYGLQG